MVNLTMPETIMPKEDFTAILAERDRLKAINAELVEALEQLAVLGEVGMQPKYDEWITFHDKVAQIARAALAKARKED